MARDVGPCRLCGAKTRFTFSKVVLHRLPVSFGECTGCGSLQTEEPYWLDESYADPRRILDVSAVHRNLSLARATYLVWKLARGVRDLPLLDWGGGDGLMVRLLRDWGLDCRYWDRYALNLYAPGHDHVEGNEQRYGIITAFEVWEHLAHPTQELDALFGHQPAIHLLTTQMYRGQDENWRYLNPLTGRHVFFYSPKAMRWIADRYGYAHAVGGSSLNMFTAPGAVSTTQLRALLWLLPRHNQRLVRAAVDLLPKQSLTTADKTFALAAARAQEPWTVYPPPTSGSS